MNYKIAIVNVKNENKKFAMNKDLNGGFGTADSYSSTIFSRIISIIKRKSIKLPIISLVCLKTILKEKGHYVKYFETDFPEFNEFFDIILVYGSIVDYVNENLVARKLKELYGNSRIGFIGPFPSIMPKLFPVDFVIKGEFENFFMQEFKDLKQLKGQINTKNKTNLDNLPIPDPEGFPINEYSYFPAISQKPFFALQSSKGCPYSCSYYCAYGKFQGPNIRTRTPKKVIQDIIFLNKKYNIKGIQFRDPTFGIKRGYIEEFCKELKDNNINVKWGIETRIDLLDKEKIRLMFDSGLKNINIGIETIDPIIAQENKRTLSNIKHQEEIIKYCKKLGVKISAFYIFAYDNDTEESVKNTLRYAKKLNTFLARFSICTPYPGTEYFNNLKKQDKILTYDFENYTQFNLVTKHKNFTPEDARKLLAKAFREYYFRPKYIFSFIIWKLRDLWL